MTVSNEALAETLHAIAGDTRGHSLNGQQHDHLRKAANRLAASAQVREVEAPLPEHPIDRAYAIRLREECPKPAAEPVPVAHDDEIAQIVRDLRDVSRTDGWVCASAAAILIEQQQATIADHARIVAELRESAQMIERESREGWKQAAHWRAVAEVAEASLAACRADAERYRWLRHKLTCGHMNDDEAASIAGSKSPESLDAAIDALRQEAT